MTEQEIINLRWAKIANDEGRRGLFGPSLRFGPIAGMSDLVARGLVELRKDGAMIDKGYWITNAGRQVLASHR